MSEQAIDNDNVVKEDDMPLEYVVDILQAEKTIDDVFTKIDDNRYKVKDKKDSKILQSHIKDAPIVPGVLLKELFLYHNNRRFTEDATLSFEFHQIILPRHVLTIRPDGIYNEDDSIVLTFEANMGSFDSSTEMNTENLGNIPEATDSQLKEYLLRSGEFSFASGFKVTDKENVKILSVHDKFQGYYKVPKNFPYTDKPLNIHYNDDEEELPYIVNPHLLDEMAAQIASFAISNDIGSNKEDGKIFLFKKTSYEHTGTKLRTGDTFYVLFTIDSIEEKEISITYTGKNQYNEEIISGKMTGIFFPRVELRKLG